MDEPVVIHPYDGAWAARFEQERERVAQVLGDAVVRIEHVGSTSVPGLSAKPVIDLDAVLHDPDDWERHTGSLAAVGYERFRRGDFADRHFFRRFEDGHRVAHLSLLGSESPVLAQHVALRDLLRARPDLAARYDELKRGLAERYGDDRDAYTQAKTAFVLEALCPGNAPVVAFLDGRGGSHEDAGYRLRHAARTAGLPALDHTLHGADTLTTADAQIVAFALGFDALYLPLEPDDVRTLTRPHDLPEPLRGWTTVDLYQHELPAGEGLQRLGIALRRAWGRATR